MATHATRWISTLAPRKWTGEIITSTNLPTSHDASLIIESTLCYHSYTTSKNLDELYYETGLSHTRNECLDEIVKTIYSTTSRF